MPMYCKFNTMMTTSLFFILYGERPVQRLRYCETRICSPTKIKLRLKVGRCLERLATLQTHCLIIRKRDHKNSKNYFFTINCLTTG